MKRPSVSVYVGLSLYQALQQAIREYHIALEKLGYQKLAGGEYEGHTSYYIHPEYIVLARRHFTYNHLDEEGMVRELGLGKLPEGVVLPGEVYY